MKGNRSILVGNALRQSGAHDMIVDQAADNDVHSIMSYSNEEAILRQKIIVEESKAIHLPKLYLPLYLKPFVEGEELTLFHSQ